MESSAHNHNIYEVSSSRKQGYRKWKVSNSSCNRCQCPCLQCLNQGNQDWREWLKVHFKDDTEVSKMKHQANVKKALFLLATRWLSWISLFFLLLLGHWKMEQNKEVDGVAGVNAGAALLWSGFLQAKDHWDSTFISHSYKQNKQECPASLCSWANSWDKEPKPNSTVSAAYKVRVRAAAWGVWKGDFALCSPFLLGFLGLWGLFLQL